MRHFARILIVGFLLSGGLISAQESSTCRSVLMWEQRHAECLPGSLEALIAATHLVDAYSMHDLEDSQRQALANIKLAQQLSEPNAEAVANLQLANTS